MKTLILSLILFAQFLYAAPYPSSQSLDGEWMYHVQNLTKSPYDTYHFKGQEQNMSLPNNWYVEGINHGGIVWFEREFDMQSVERDHQHYLYFTGVDYLCDIWVNDHYVGNHEGYFQTFMFNVSEYLQEGANRIKVRVNSPLENYPEHYSLHKTLLRGIFSHHDTRPGGAWSPEGQDKNSGGIWNHIALYSYQKYKFSKLKVTPTLAQNAVKVHVDFELEKFEGRSSQEENETQEMEVRIEPLNFAGKSYIKKYQLSNLNTHQEIALDLSLSDAKLWYTHDRGFAHMYLLKVTIGQTEKSVQVGFRELRQDAHQVYHLNGKALYLKGTNYISSQYMSQMSESKLRADLELMKAAHINTIRVHAHIEPKRFYRLCDQMGFLVWQDYNLQWGYIQSTAFENEAVKQAKEMVDMLYNHPSIYLWSMHNEPPWNSEWMQWKYPDYNKSINQALDKRLYDEMSRYDDFHIIKKFSSNLEHPWYGWYSGKYQDFAQASKVPVVSEYGAQALPNLESLKKFIPQKYLLPKGKRAKKLWEYHNFQFNWNEKNGVRFKETTEQFIQESQSYQAKLLKFATEMLRIQKYTGTTAIFQFMFNEGWPSMNWGIVDYYRQPKPGYEALKKAYAPTIAVAKQTQENMLAFYVVHDGLQALEHASLEIIVQTAGEKYLYTYPITIQADGLVHVASMKLQAESTIDMRLIHDSHVYENHYTFKPFIDKKEGTE